MNRQTDIHTDAKTEPPCRRQTDREREREAYPQSSADRAQPLCASIKHYVWMTLLTVSFSLFLHCALASCGAVYCNCSCLCVCGCVCVCLFVCGSVTTITRNCVHRSSPNWVCIGKGSDHLQLIKFWPSCTSGKGV